MTAWGEPERWLRDAVSAETDDCVIWPFARSKGYGVLRRGPGSLKKATHIALLLVGRSSPGRDEVCRHTCDVRACVNPKHLIVGTHVENARDRLDHGHMAITAADVVAIRSVKAPNAVIARWFGISRTTVANIRSLNRWKMVE